MAAKVSGLDMTMVTNKEISSDAITVSLVSHGHGSMVAEVLGDLATMTEVARIVLTLNIPEPLPTVPAALQHKLRVIENRRPQGFAANHNAAFMHCETRYFCVLNPDIRMRQNPFPRLVDALTACNAALVAPLAVNSADVVEDSMRFFPTPFRLLKKALGLSRGSYQVRLGDPEFATDWIAGMCLLFLTAAFRELGGFDEGYFLYYEDVDICARAWRQGMSVIACPSVAVVHDAQRTSHRNLKFLRWHLSSMLRFFRKHYGRLPDSKADLIEAE